MAFHRRTNISLRTSRKRCNSGSSTFSRSSAYARLASIVFEADLKSCILRQGNAFLQAGGELGGSYVNHASTSRVFSTTFASGYAFTNSGIKTAGGLSVTAYMISQKLVLSAVDIAAQSPSTDLTVPKKFVPVFLFEATDAIKFGSNGIHPHLAVLYVLMCGGHHMICVLVPKTLQRRSYSCYNPGVMLDFVFRTEYPVNRSFDIHEVPVLGSPAQITRMGTTRVQVRRSMLVTSPKMAAMVQNDGSQTVSHLVRNAQRTVLSSLEHLLSMMSAVVPSFHIVRISVFLVLTLEVRAHDLYFNRSPKQEDMSQFIKSHFHVAGGGCGTDIPLPNATLTHLP